MTAATRTRLTPVERRRQLLDLGARLLATRSIGEISIDLLAEQAGVSRGLVYHYFDDLHDFRRAVIRHAVDDLVAQTAPPAEGEPFERLVTSMAAYVDYVATNFAGYRSIVKAAAGGTEAMRELYEEARSALTDRIFREDAQGEILADTPAARLVVRGWSAMAEEVVLTWVEDPRAMNRDELLDFLARSLPALVDLTRVDPL